MLLTLSPLMNLGLPTFVFSIALLLALGIDHYLGEPPVRCHPVVWMGNYLGWAGSWLAPQMHGPAHGQAARDAQSGSPVTQPEAPDYKAFCLGALLWLVGVAIVCVAEWALQKGLLALPDALGPLWGGLFAALLLGVALKPMLAWAMLRSEVLAVEKALSPEHGGSLAQGRERLSWLVGRSRYAE